MISISAGSCQPQREPWTIDRLVHERSIALGFSIDNSSHITYTSALSSYLTFCKIHNFNIEPTEQTLSFFVVYMSSHIKPSSVNSYLSGICNQLEPFFPNVRKSRNSMLVSRTMTGCQRRFGTPVKRKRPLSTDDLKTVISAMGTSAQHDDKLFLAMLLTGFHGLMHLGEPLSQTAWHTAIIVKSFCDTLSTSPLSPTHFCCLAIRPTALMREI